MILPDLTLARAITAAVMAEIERSGTISSAALDEVIFAKLLFANATQQPSQPADNSEDLLAKYAGRLLDEISGHTLPPGGWSRSITAAFLDLSTLLSRLGKR